MAVTSPGWIVMYLILLYATGGSATLSCYTCNSDHNANCDVASANTTIRVCKPHQQYCQKKVVHGAGQRMVERQCYQVCNQQEGVAMGYDVSIDVYCCSTPLCNTAASVTSLGAALGSMLVAVYANWRPG